MINVSFAMTREAFDDGTKTETRRYWTDRHAAKFKPGVVFYGISKDFRAGGVRLHKAVVASCYKQRLGDMSERSFQNEGGTRYWRNRKAYIEAMGGEDAIVSVLSFIHLRAFASVTESGDFSESIDCVSLLSAVKRFDINMAKWALVCYQNHLQTTVMIALERRIKALEKEASHGIRG